jgi:putative hydrolase of HD superfamily
MKKPEKVLSYYLLCNKLKNTIRTGWENWHVNAERVESIAEHVYGVQMLAIAMASEYKYEIDLEKVILMLAIHELEETIIGDLTLFQIDKATKEEAGHKAIKRILKNLVKGKEIEKIILEFDARETEEAKFAYQCDKLECAIQAKLYGERNTVDLNHQEGNISMNDPKVQELLGTGKGFGEMWMMFWEQKAVYDKNFLEVSNYALDNKIDNIDQEI